METVRYDEIEEIPKETTLRAMAQADKILDAWERMKEEEQRLPDKKRTSADKRAKRVRDCTQSDEFIKDWERLERSGKLDMHRLKEAMLLLIANDGSLPPEWKDPQLERTT